MTTDRQRIQAYIKPDIYEKFAAFKKSNDFSESEALGTILAQFFGLVSSPTTDTDALSALRENVEKQIALLSDRLSALESDHQGLKESIQETLDDTEPIADEQGISKTSRASIFEDVPTEVVIQPKATEPNAVSKEEKKLIETIKKELKAIGFTFAVWRQTGYGVWLIWNDRSERYKSAKIRLYKDKGAWKLVRINSEHSWVPVSENNQVNKAIAPLLLELKRLSINPISLDQGLATNPAVEASKPS